MNTLSQNLKIYAKTFKFKSLCLLIHHMHNEDSFKRQILT